MTPIINPDYYLAVKNLPDIILGTIGKHSLGIMIARGDLAVELGSASCRSPGGDTVVV